MKLFLISSRCKQISMNTVQSKPYLKSRGRDPCLKTEIKVMPGTHEHQLSVS